MKKVQIKHISQKNGKYIVSLGNGQVHEFTSKREANYFLNRTSKFLTRKLFHAHELYKRIWNRYHEVWFLLTPAFERDLQDACNNIEKARHFAVTRSDWTNGNYFIFVHLGAMCDNMKHMLEILQEMYIRRSNTPALYVINNFYQEIFDMENTIKEYGRHDADYFIKIPKLTERDVQYIPNIRIA